MGLERKFLPGVRGGVQLVSPPAASGNAGARRGGGEEEEGEEGFK